MSARSLFAAMSKTVLNVLGESAVFGTASTPTNINIQYAVALQGMQSDDGAFAKEYSAEADVATIDGALSPKRGDVFRLLNADGSTLATYRLEKLLRNNGVNQQFIVLKVG